DLFDIFGIGRVGQLGGIEPRTLIANDEAALLMCHVDGYIEPTAGIWRFVWAIFDELLIDGLITFALFTRQFEIAVDNGVPQGFFQGDANAEDVGFVTEAHAGDQALNVIDE